MVELVTKPVLKPSFEYTFLLFSRIPRSDIIEVYLPNSESYIVTWNELKVFLDKSGIQDLNGLMSHIYNFNNVLWRRMDQRYRHINREDIIGEEKCLNLI